MREKYVRIAEYYEKLAESYRDMAESAENTGNTTQKTENKDSVSFEAVSELAKKKAAEGKSTAVKAIINGAGFKKLSDIPAKFYADILKKLEEL